MKHFHSNNARVRELLEPKKPVAAKT